MSRSATVSSGGWLWCIEQLQCAPEVGSGVFISYSVLQRLALVYRSATVCSEVGSGV